MLVPAGAWGLPLALQADEQLLAKSLWDIRARTAAMRRNDMEH